MRAAVKAVTPDEYEAWAQAARRDIEAAGKALARAAQGARRGGEPRDGSRDRHAASQLARPEVVLHGPQAASRAAGSPG